MDAAEALAVVVRGIRRGQGLSQEDINNLGRSHFSRIERGEVSIGLDVLVRLAGILDLDPATLLLMATSMQNHESFKDGQKRLTKQLARIRKAGIDLEIESQARAGKPPPGRPARSWRRVDRSTASLTRASQALRRFQVCRSTAVQTARRLAP